MLWPKVGQLGEKTMLEDLQSAFNNHDQKRLSQSVAWQKDPLFVESMCRLLHDVDPMGCWSSENPHVMTEYLREVEMIAMKLPGIGSEQDLLNALREVFDEMFEGQPTDCDWGGLAKAAWLIPPCTARG